MLRVGASQHHNSGAPRASRPKAVINYINGGPSDEEYDSRRKRQKLLRAASIREHQFHPAWTNWRGPSPIDGTIIFPPVDPTRTLQPHRDALILSLEIGDFDVRRILWLTQQLDRSCASIGRWPHGTQSHRPRKPWTNPVRIQRVVNYVLGRHYTAVQAGPVTLNVQFSVVQDLSLQCHLGGTWLHYMKAIPSTYHQMVSFLTKDGQVNLYGSQLAARQCYQIARETGTSQEDASLPESSNPHDQ
ncbi:hypothetical protein CK203_105105 [Vitis vinifera]|uniref:Uncharacterized protein n=1 Tax=Vitis vinifera TaxID=29760 RepID=A0A438CNT1_VITVI|nr:hypothetical protein CK203_105105 [Vitis vinifera]